MVRELFQDVLIKTPWECNCFRLTEKLLGEHEGEIEVIAHHCLYTSMIF